jgi:predicted ATPase
MLLEEISLSNFKCFRKARLACSRLTILTGANSSGKSSLLAAILGIVQTDQFPLFYSPNGEFVNMGDFGEIAFRHKRDTEIVIRAVVSEPSSENRNAVISASYIEDVQTGMPSLKSLRVLDSGLNLRVGKTEQYIASYRYSPSRDPLFQIQGTQQFRHFIESLTAGFAGLAEQADPSRNKDAMVNELRKLWEVSPSTAGRFEFHSLTGLSAAAEQQNIYIRMRLDDLNRRYRRLKQKFNYISSFRLPPERTYYQVSKADLKVGRIGENTVNQIAEWESKGAPEYGQLQDHLRSLDLVTDLRTRSLSGGRFEILLRTQKGAVFSSLVDVGFGISQFLPIIVADLQLGDESTLVVSQPETHLHPSVQAQFANYLVQQMKRGKRYLIETHSEYFLNRLRLIIAQEQLAESDVGVVYLHNTPKGAQIHQIEFKKNGEIRGAPSHFFETYMLDVMNIAMEA